MDEGKRELVGYLLERYAEEEPPDTVKLELARALIVYGEGREILRELGQVSLDHARRALALAEDELYHYDLEYLRQEIYLLEDEQEAAALAATSDEPTLEAHTALFALLPQGTESTQRRRRVIAMALAANLPERAAAFIAGYKPDYDDMVEFWGGFRRSLYLRLKGLAPLHAIGVLELPFDAHSWLFEVLIVPGSDPMVVEKLVERVLGMEMPIVLPLPDTIDMIDALCTRDIAGRTELLCLLALCGSRNVDDRPELLKYLLHTGISLPEADRASLVDAIRKEGLTYLKTEHRREVLKRLAHFARHCHSEIRREIRILRAIALLEHLSPSRLAQAHTWVQAYDRRFRKRLQAIQREREELQGQILIFLRALAQQRGAAGA